MKSSEKLWGTGTRREASTVRTGQSHLLTSSSSHRTMSFEYGNNTSTDQDNAQSLTSSPCTRGRTRRPESSRSFGTSRGSANPSSSPRIAPKPIESIDLTRRADCPPCSTTSLSAIAPPPPMLQGCFSKHSRGTSETLKNSLCDPVWSICVTIADQTSPFAASSGIAGSPRMPITARTLRSTGRRCRPNRITVGVPWPGM